MTGRLHGTCVLVVEDDFLIASEICAALAEVGARVVGPCASAPDAIRILATEHVDIAVLDVLLLDGDSAPVAACLDDRGIPYVLATAAEAPLIPLLENTAPVVGKPTDFAKLAATLCQVLEREAQTIRRTRDPAL